MVMHRFGQRAAFIFDADMRMRSAARTLGYLDSFLLHAKEQAFLPENLEFGLEDSPWEQEALEAELEFLDLEWSERIPSYFYGSLVILIWGELEAIIERFTKESQLIKSASISFKDTEGKTIYSRLKKYTLATLGVTLPAANFIDDLQFLRNIFAHHGGDIRSKSGANTVKRIKQIEKKYPGVSLLESYVVVNSEYLNLSLERANSLIETLHSIHPSDEPDWVEIENDDQ